MYLKINARSFQGTKDIIIEWINCVWKVNSKDNDGHMACRLRIEQRIAECLHLSN